MDIIRNALIKNSDHSKPWAACTYIDGRREFQRDEIADRLCRL
ncbi:hypothetical protein [Clostridium thermarum]|nr:hypothetical protein [Clostridium thermarum]